MLGKPKQGWALIWTCVMITSTCAARDAARARARVRIHHERSTESEMFASVDAFGSTNDLVLERVEVPSIPISELVVGPNGTLVTVDVSEQIEKRKFFIDREKGSLLYLNDKNTLEGMVTDSLGLRYENNEHIATKLDGTEENFCITIPINESARSQPSESPLRSAVPFLVVEVTVMSDSTLRAKFSSVTDLHNYLMLYWNMVNRRFKTVRSTDLIIEIHVTESLFSGSSVVDSYFMDATSATTSNAYSSLNSFKSHIRDQISLGNYKLCDVAHLMTARHLFYQNSNSGAQEFSVLGLAHTGGVCLWNTGENTGIAEDFGFYEGMLTTAHEIGHNLGAPHDGQDSATSCSYNQANIMSDYRSSSNSYSFSSCSSSAMRNTYYNWNKDCLHTFSNGEYFVLNPTLPGEYFSLDEQCRIRTGASNAVVDSSKPASSHCYHLSCKRALGGGGILPETFFYSALEGTYCYGGGRCLNGYCQ